MSVVSNTSPLNYLLLIGCADVLPGMYGTISVPPAVVAELRAAKSPDRVRTWAESPPAWLRVEEPTRTLARELGYLGRGEHEAILLASVLPNTGLLIDDRDGRREAERLGIPVIGTLGILVDAAQMGLLKLEEAVKRLQGTNFRASEALLKSIVKKGGN